jgi:hypothetical protein
MISVPESIELETNHCHYSHPLSEMPGYPWHLNSLIARRSRIAPLPA